MAVSWVLLIVLSSFYVGCANSQHNPRRPSGHDQWSFNPTFGVFCEKCDLLHKRYCYEMRCDRSHFCYLTATASGCGNPYMHTLNDCKSMHGSDCCYARKDLHGTRFNASNCIHPIPKVMCHKCTRLGGCEAVGCTTGNLCYANRFDSGCANTSSVTECSAKFDRCCEGNTSLIAWNAHQCQAEPAPECETCPEQLKQDRLSNCTSDTCPGLCFRRDFNKTRDGSDNLPQTVGMIETGCSSEVNVEQCNDGSRHCCTSYNQTNCIHNYTVYTASIELKLLITFAILFFLMIVILSLCFSET